MKRQKGFISILMVIIVVSIIGVGVYLYNNKNCKTHIGRGFLYDYPDKINDPIKTAEQVVDNIKDSNNLDLINITAEDDNTALR